MIAFASQLALARNLDELLDAIDGPPLLLILDGITDPHNLGACLRTADAAGVQAVIVPKDKSATLNATVRKVACGAAEVIPLVAVTNLARTLEKLQQRGLWVVGTAGEADKTLYQLDLKGPTVLVMGAALLGGVVVSAGYGYLAPSVVGVMLAVAGIAVTVVALATARRQPTRSPRSGPAISATTRGEAKVIEVTCASGSPGVGTTARKPSGPSR